MHVNRLGGLIWVHARVQEPSMVVHGGSNWVTWDDDTGSVKPNE